MLSIIGMILLVIIAFCVGIVIWKWCELGGEGNKFDQKAYSAIMDARLKKQDLEKAMSSSIRQLNQATRKALEEDMGTNEFRNYLRG